MSFFLRSHIVLSEQSDHLARRHHHLHDQLFRLRVSKLVKFHLHGAAPTIDHTVRVAVRHVESRLGEGEVDAAALLAVAATTMCQTLQLAQRSLQLFLRAPRLQTAEHVLGGGEKGRRLFQAENGGVAGRGLTLQCGCGGVGRIANGWERDGR